MRLEFKMIRVRIEEDRDVLSVTLSKNQRIDELVNSGWEPFSVVRPTHHSTREIWFKRLASAG